MIRILYINGGIMRISNTNLKNQIIDNRYDILIEAYKP